MASFTLTNRSGYDTGDLRRFFRVALARLGVKRHKQIVITASPIRTRGCAEVGPDRCGSGIVIAIAPPSSFTMAKFSRIVQHELAHAKGAEHGDMPERLLYSEGGALPWARNLRIRYRGRAPNQMLGLGASRRSGGSPSRDVAPVSSRRGSSGSSFGFYLREVTRMIASLGRMDGEKATRLAMRWRSMVQRFYAQKQSAMFAADHVIKYQSRGLCPCPSGSGSSDASRDAHRRTRRCR